MSSIIGESGYDRKDLDAYWTRPWVTEWLLDATRHTCNLGVDRVVWEPCCGRGHISDVLRGRGFDVLSTDVADHGYSGMAGETDFLSVSEVDPSIGAIITNPPYDLTHITGDPRSTAEGFLRHALALMKPGRGQVFMILRNEFDCAKGRRDLFDDYPFAGKYILTKRPEWTDESMPVKEKASPRHNFAWFHWDWAQEPDFYPCLYILPFRERSNGIPAQT